MGYTTDFTGSWQVTPPLKPEHRDYLSQFSETRRMKRDAAKASTIEDPLRVAAGLPVGPEGAYFVNVEGFAGQGADHSVVDQNRPPDGQPGLWCLWVPTRDGTEIVWDGGEKFYNYEDWIAYLIQHFLDPWGYKLNGAVEWFGEDREDLGIIAIEDNEISVSHGRIVYD